jgi:hypothetical protein
MSNSTEEKLTNNIVKDKNKNGKIMLKVIPYILALSLGYYIGNNYIEPEPKEAYKVSFDEKSLEVFNVEPLKSY